MSKKTLMTRTFDFSWFVFALLIFQSTVFIKSFALEIDEKLTTRVLKTTRSKKTVLINRGSEDGLVKGDHAKFYTGEGVIFRGVVVEISPTRSVWSVYRVVNANAVNPDQVMNLKITEALKLTQDPSKMIVEDDTPKVTDPSRSAEGIPLAEGAYDLEDDRNVATRSLLKNPRPNWTDISERNIELYGTVSFQSFTSSVDNNSAVVDGSSSYSLFSFGLEYYSQNPDSFLGKFSIFPFVQSTQQGWLSYEGSQVDSSIFEVGGGINWHPINPPNLTNHFIFFAQLTYAIGRISDSFSLGTATDNSVEIEGTTNSYSVGGGLKYYTQKALGFRMLVDYYSRSDSFDSFDQLSYDISRDQSGPRIMMGLSYRM